MVYIYKCAIGFCTIFVFSIEFRSTVLQGAEGFVQGASVLLIVLLELGVLE